MIEHPLKDANNQDLRQIALKDETFGRPVREDLLARMVQYQLAKRRSGCASTKTRSDVRGGGRKPYRQKGTGNARQGTIRAPQFRTGGVVFGPHPRSYATSLPKKVRRLALQTALSVKRIDGDLILLDKLEMAEIKTKAMRTILSNLGAERSALIVIPAEDVQVQVSARNLPGISVIRVEGVNVYDLLRHEKVIITEAALDKLEERLA
ncbi:MAG: 50S ribosomal protein L4 [Magnetococcus sp. DMHC-1]|nr:50S ribosomal protein L4 [Magnetococcales bacterium]